ncbi:MAG: LURP-one-related family protein [Clostridiales bacterium]|nr:LURP-one-related family protein [Clostridiales bacterium]
MQILLKKNLFSLIKKYSVKDSSGRDLLRVEKKPFSITDKHKVMDLTENCICEIKKKVWSIFPKYRIIFTGGEVLEVSKNRGIINKKFFIKSLNSEYLVEGNVIDNEFQIKNGQEEIAKVQRTVINMFKAYDIQIREIKNVPIVISAIIAMDIIKYKKLSYLI